MNSNEGNYCPLQQSHEIVMKTEPLALDDDKKFDDSILSSAKLKCENGQSDCDRPSAPCSIKQGLENSGDTVNQVQLKELELEGEMDIDEHKPGSELVERSVSVGAGIFKDGSKEGDSVQGNEGELKDCPHCPFQSKCNGSLAAHMGYFHGHLKIHKCRERYHELKGRSNVSKHYKHEKVMNVYKCSECSHETKMQSDLVLHFKSVHSIRRR